MPAHRTVALVEAPPAPVCSPRIRQPGDREPGYVAPDLYELTAHSPRRPWATPAGRAQSRPRPSLRSTQWTGCLRHQTRTRCVGPAHIIAIVLRDGLVAAVVGLVLGTGGALLATQVLRATLVRTDPRDPGVLAASAVVLVLVSLLSAYVPARWAARVNPASTLRGE